MSPHTFRAPQLMDALETVQKQLGPDALIVSVRQVMGGPIWQPWKRPGVEVVAMPANAPRPEGGGASSKAERPGPPNRREGHLPSKPTAAGDERPGLTAAVGGAARGKPEISPLLGKFRDRLKDQGVDPGLIDKVSTACANSLSLRSLGDETRLYTSLRKQLEAEITTTRRAIDARVICLIGPRGCGKTSTIAKLAAYHRQDHAGGIVWVCADTVRAGAIAEARVYAESMGITLRVAYTPEDLAMIVNAEQDARLILVDTPGCNPRNEANLVELGAILAELEGRHIYLAAPATAKDSDLAQMFAAFSPFGLAGLIVTKMDETDRFGDVFNLVWRSRLPIHYYTTGSKALGDLLPGEPGPLVKALLR